jgi:hypothetical protein
MEVNKVDPIQSQRDKMVENFFDAVRSDDQVHGRMLRISSVPAPQPWKGTSATWQSIKALNLNNTVDIVTLNKNNDLFSSTSVSEDDLESCALEIFQAEAARRLPSGSKVYPWIDHRANILQAHLQKIIAREILPIYLHAPLSEAVDRAAMLVNNWLYTAAPETSDSSDDDSTDDSTAQYFNDSNLQQHLSSSASEDDEDDESDDEKQEIISMEQPSLFAAQEQATVPDTVLSVQQPDYILLRPLTAQIVSDQQAATSLQFDTPTTPALIDHQSYQSFVLTACTGMGLDKSRDYYAITPEMLNLFNTICDATPNAGLGDVEELFIADVGSHLKHCMETKITEQPVTADLLSAHGQPSVDEDIRVQTENETPLNPHCPDSKMFFADFAQRLHRKSGMELEHVHSILDDTFREILSISDEILDIRKQTPITAEFYSDDYLAEFEYEMNQPMPQPSSKQEDLADIIRGQQLVEEVLCGKHGIVLATFPDEAGTAHDLVHYDAYEICQDLHSLHDAILTIYDQHQICSVR